MSEHNTEMSVPWQIERDISTSKTANLSEANWKNSGCFQDRTKAVNEISCPTQVERFNL